MVFTTFSTISNTNFKWVRTPVPSANRSHGPAWLGGNFLGKSPPKIMATLNFSKSISEVIPVIPPFFCLVYMVIFLL